MTRLLLSLSCVLLCACAGPRPVGPPPDSLFQDDAFAAPADRFRADDLFALNEPMRRFVDQDIAQEVRREGPINALIHALYGGRALKLEYDPTTTRNASEAFEARAGNCLSLVIMTAAFAKELGIQVQYNAARIDEMWSRTGGLLVGSGHVNVTLGAGLPGLATRVFQAPTTVDFLPSDEIGGLPIREISEETVVAMYMNNRAVEALVRADVDDAYGWARAAIHADPEFPKSYNTLGIVYLQHRDPSRAAGAFRYGLQREPGNPAVISNLADALTRIGDQAGAAALQAQLAQLDPDPPYHFFDLGMQAMQRGDFQAARRLFAREVDRADYNDEFHYWLGIACLKLGDIERARRELKLALDRSRSASGHERYAAKLAWLKSNDPTRPREAAPAAPPAQ